MARVTGIGGVFVRARDPAATRAWYARVLGVEASEHGAIFAAQPEGMTVWNPFAADTSYFDPSTAAVMLNLAMDDLDGVMARVRAEGVELLGTQDDAYGRFAWLLDPDGIKLELWQAAPDGAPEDANA